MDNNELKKLFLEKTKNKYTLPYFIFMILTMVFCISTLAFENKNVKIALLTLTVVSYIGWFYYERKFSKRKKEVNKLIKETNEILEEVHEEN